MSRNCSSFFRPLREVSFFSAPSCLISSSRMGTICCFCCSVSPSSMENWSAISVSGLTAICGAGMIS